MTMHLTRGWIGFAEVEPSIVDGTESLGFQNCDVLAIVLSYEYVCHPLADTLGIGVTRRPTIKLKDQYSVSIIDQSQRSHNHDKPVSPGVRVGTQRIYVNN